VRVDGGGGALAYRAAGALMQFPGRDLLAAEGADTRTARAGRQSEWASGRPVGLRRHWLAEVF